MSFRPGNGARGRPPGRVPGGGPGDLSPAEKRAQSGGVGRLGLVPVVLGLLLIVVGAVFLWLSYGDRAGGTSVFEDSVESGPEPALRLVNGSGKVRVEGVEGLESVEIEAKRYARGLDPAAAQENAAEVAVDIANDDSTVEVYSDGGRGTGVDYDLRVPAGSVVEVESATGDVEVSDIAGGATILAEAGDVTVNGALGSVEVEAPRGDVTVGDVSTETGSVRITAGIGDISLEDLVVGILEVRVEAGDAYLSGRFSGGGGVLVETGNINSSLPPEDERDLTLEARVGEVAREQEGE